MLRPKCFHFSCRPSVYQGCLFPQLGFNHVLQKVEGIRTWPVRLSIRTYVQRFLVHTSQYRNFTRKFAYIATPLTGLLKKEKQIVWTEAEETAAKNTHRLPLLFSVLALPHFNERFLLTTSESNAAVGVVLFQKAYNSKRHQLIARDSHRFIPR